MAKFDEKGRQPEVVNLVINVDMEISDPIEVYVRNQRYFYDFSALCLTFYRGQFLINLDVEVFMLVLIRKIDASLLVDLVIDVKNDPHLV